MWNWATRWIVLSWRASRPATAHVCQYVVPTTSAASSSSATTVTRPISLFSSVRLSSGFVRPVGDEQQPGEEDEVGDDARPAVADEGQGDPGQRRLTEQAADVDEGLERERKRQPSREELREAVVGEYRRAEAAQGEEHVGEQDGGNPDQAELLGERGVDEVAVHERDQVGAVRGREGPASEARSAEMTVGDRVRALDGLVAGAVHVRPRVEPAVDALLDAGDRGVRHGRAAEEQSEADRDVEGAAGRDVQHREEDPEVEERAAEVVGLDEDEHRRAPDQEQWAEVLQPPLREHLALLPQIAREEDDQRDLRELAGLELQRPDLHPEPRSVDRPADHWQRREHEQADRRDAEEVLVALQHAEVGAEGEHGGGERRHPDDDP